MPGGPGQVADRRGVSLLIAWLYSSLSNSSAPFSTVLAAVVLLYLLRRSNVNISRSGDAASTATPRGSSSLGVPRRIPTTASKSTGAASTATPRVTSSQGGARRSHGTTTTTTTSKSSDAASTATPRGAGTSFRGGASGDKTRQTPRAMI